jgi:hypothetical protein
MPSLSTGHSRTGGPWLVLGTLLSLAAAATRTLLRGTRAAPNAGRRCPGTCAWKKERNP